MLAEQPCICSASYYIGLEELELARHGFPSGQEQCPGSGCAHSELGKDADSLGGLFLKLPWARGLTKQWFATLLLGTGAGCPPRQLSLHSQGKSPLGSWGAAGLGAAAKSGPTGMLALQLSSPQGRQRLSPRPNQKFSGAVITSPARR